MENLLFLGVPILKHIRVISGEIVFQDDFNWQIVPSTNGCSNSTQKISLPYGVHADSIRFGVSVGVGGVSGGIAWEACRFDAMFEGK